MNPDVIEFAQVAAIFVASFAALGVVVLAFSAAGRMVRRMGSREPAPRVDDQRMARLEQAVDTIAVEVERISESQRFISRLLGERSQESTKLPP